MTSLKPKQTSQEMMQLNKILICGSERQATLKFYELLSVKSTDQFFERSIPTVGHVPIFFLLGDWHNQQQRMKHFNESTKIILFYSDDKQSSIEYISTQLCGQLERSQLKKAIQISPFRVYKEKINDIGKILQDNLKKLIINKNQLKRHQKIQTQHYAIDLRNYSLDTITTLRKQILAGCFIPVQDNNVQNNQGSEWNLTQADEKHFQKRSLAYNNLRLINHKGKFIKTRKLKIMNINISNRSVVFAIQFDRHVILIFSILFDWEGETDWYQIHDNTLLNTQQHHILSYIQPGQHASNKYNKKANINLFLQRNLKNSYHGIIKRSKRTKFSLGNQVYLVFHRQQSWFSMKSIIVYAISSKFYLFKHKQNNHCRTQLTPSITQSYNITKILITVEYFKLCVFFNLLIILIIQKLNQSHQEFPKLKTKLNKHQQVYLASRNRFIRLIKIVDYWR